MDGPIKWWRITDGNILTDVAIWFVALTPVILYPWIYEPFGFGRYLMFMFGLAVLLLGVLLTNGCLRLSRAWWRHPLVWLSIGWWLAAVVSAALGVNPARSWWGTVIRAEGLFFLTGLIVLGVSLLTLVQREAGWLKIFSTMTWVGAASGLYALLQPLKLPLMLPIEAGGRATALMGNPIFLGQLLLLTIFITLYFVYATKDKLRWLYSISLLLQIIGLAMTVSRGPLLGLAFGSTVWLIGWLLLRGRKVIQVSWSWLLGGLLAILVAVGGSWYLWPHQLQRLFVLGDSFRARLGIWQTAWSAIKDHPWLGYGNENARYGLAHFYQSGLADISMAETTTDRAHNFILDQLLTNGWLGLVIMLLIVCYGLWLLWRGFRSASRQQQLVKAMLFWSLFSATTAYLVATLFAFDVVTTSLYLTVVMTGIIFLTSAELPEPVKLLSSYFWSVGLLLLGLIFFDVKYLLPAWRIGQYVGLAQAAVERNDYRSANLSYIKAQRPVNPYRWPYLATYPTFARKYALLILDKENNTSWANELATDGLRVLDGIRKNEPDRIGLFTEYQVLYAILATSDSHYYANAQASFDELVKEFPNHEYLYMSWARALIGMGQYSEAKTVLDQAAQLKSAPKELGFWRAVARIRLKDKDQTAIVNDLAQSAAENMRFDDGDQGVLSLVIDYLVGAHQWQSAVFYQEKLVSISPDDLTQRSNLLTIYKNLDQLDEVVRVARDIVTLDPGKWTQVQEFLQTIGRSL